MTDRNDEDALRELFGDVAEETEKIGGQTSDLHIIAGTGYDPHTPLEEEQFGHSGEGYTTIGEWQLTTPEHSETKYRPINMPTSVSQLSGSLKAIRRQVEQIRAIIDSVDLVEIEERVTSLVRLLNTIRPEAESRERHLPAEAVSKKEFLEISAALSQREVWELLARLWENGGMEIKEAVEHLGRDSGAFSQAARIHREGVISYEAGEVRITDLGTRLLRTFGIIEGDTSE